MKGILYSRRGCIKHCFGDIVHQSDMAIRISHATPVEQGMSCDVDMHMFHKRTRPVTVRSRRRGGPSSRGTPWLYAKTHQAIHIQAVHEYFSDSPEKYLLGRFWKVFIICKVFIGQTLGFQAGRQKYIPVTFVCMFVYLSGNWISGKYLISEMYLMQRPSVSVELQIRG